MPSGDRGFNDFEGIVIGAPDRDPVRSQLIRQAVQFWTDGNKPGHAKRIFSGRDFIIEKIGLNQSIVKSIPDDESAGVVKPALEFENHTADKLHIVVFAPGCGLVDEIILQGDPEVEGFGERGFRPDFGVDQIILQLVHLR